jgi:AAA+ ATPase superfamily predicted ATPase
MNFYDRENELSALRTGLAGSKSASRFTMITGRRRIGKTALLMEFAKDETMLYLFVSRVNEALLCESYQQRAEQILGMRIFGKITHFADLFEQLLLYATDHPFTLIIDEFQDFEKANPAIFSQIQNLWDQYKASTHMNLIASGSVYTLMVKLFEDSKEALFGRLDAKLIVRPFATKVCKQIIAAYNPGYEPEDLLCMYMLTGGVPKYIELLMDAGAHTKEKMLGFAARLDSPFISEGKDLLLSEFGRDYSIYFSILVLIATGMTLQNEIDSCIGKNIGAYMENLESTCSRHNGRNNFVSTGGFRLIQSFIGAQEYFFSILGIFKYFTDTDAYCKIKLFVFKHYCS